MSNVDETYRKINRFDDLDIFSRAKLMNTGKYDEYLQEKELETYKQALLDIKEYCKKEIGNIIAYFDYIDTKDLENILEIVNKALGDKENE